MTLNAFLMIARRKLLWLPVLIAIFVVAGLLYYGSLRDRYVTQAVITSKTSEDRSFDAGTLSGLASLAGGGQRPVFEQFAFLLRSDAMIRRLTPELRRHAPALVKELLGRPAFGQFRVGLEDSARSMFGKPPKVLPADDRLVEAIRGHLKITKTPEGYIQLAFTSGTDAGQTRLIQGLLRESDAVIRTRERVDYRNRVNNYQDLLLQRTRPTEKFVIVNLIGREYANYITAQSGETFSFTNVEPVISPKRVYSTSLFTILILSVFTAVVAFAALIVGFMWVGRR